MEYCKICLTARAGRQNCETYRTHTLQCIKLANSDLKAVTSINQVFQCLVKQIRFELCKLNDWPTITTQKIECVFQQGCSWFWLFDEKHGEDLGLSLWCKNILHYTGDFITVFSYFKGWWIIDCKFNNRRCMCK